MGMLDENQPPGAAAQPGAATPPQVATPVPEAAPVGAAPGGLQGNEDELIREGVKLLYSDRYDKMMKMFHANGAERYPISMATAVNTVITDLEKKRGPMSPETAAVVGMQLFKMLSEDIVGSEEIPGLNEQILQQSLNETLTMYAQTHPDTVTVEDMQNLVQEIQSQSQAITGAQPGEQPPLAEAAAPQPAQPMV